MAQGVDHGLADEGWASGEQFVEDGAEAVDIGRDGERAFAAGLLGRDVMRGAKDGGGDGEAAVVFEPFGEAEVAYVRLAGVVE